MNCSRCAAELPNSATFCPSCGATTTQGLLPAFSYLPPGTPPWPSTALHKLAQNTDEAAVKVKPEDKTPKKPRPSAKSVLLSIALIILTPLLGIGITMGVLYSQGSFPASAGSTKVHPVQVQNTPAATADTLTPSAQADQLPTPTAFKKATSPDVNISLQYPDDWIADAPQSSTEGVIVAIHPQEKIGISFYVIKMSDSTSSQVQTADDLNQANLAGIGSSQDVHDLQSVPSPNGQPTIAGTQWVQKDAVFTNSSGLKIHIITISAQHNNGYYNIVVFTPDMYYSEAMRKYINPMLSSVQFLS